MWPQLTGLLGLAVSLGLASPFGGWGPGEDYGHTGALPPPHNPNAVFGYDAFRLTNNRFNYRSGLALYLFCNFIFCI